MFENLLQVFLKRKITFLLSLLLIGGTISAQNKKHRAEGVTTAIFLDIKEKENKSISPPFLEITNLTFTDEDGNRKINAGEKVFIRFDVKNTGMGSGLGLNAIVKETSGIIGLDFVANQQMENLPVNKSVTVEIPVTGSMDLVTGKAEFELVIDEANGFDSDAFPVVVETSAFRSPSIKIVDYQVSSQRTSTLEKKRPFDLEVLVQNLGLGSATDINLKLEIPLNSFCLSANQNVKIASLSPGEKYIISYNLITTADFMGDSIPFEFSLSEKYDLYSENRSITLAMNQSVSKNKLVIDGKNDLLGDITIATLGSDIDKGIPVLNEKKNENRLALIFGNEKYSQSLNSEMDVAYAVSDAEIFYEYAINVLGVEEKNARIFINSSAATMKREIERIVKLAERMGAETELLFYYAGHGYPDEKTKSPCLIPVDVNSSDLSDAISLENIYKQFGKTGAKRVTVFLDACFSGGGRSNGLLAARSVRIKPTSISAAENMVVFAAASEEQVALPFHEQQHGLFTYYLLKRLKETKGEVSYGELATYLKRQVGIESVRIEREQDPVINTTIAGEEWRNYKF